MFSHLALCTRAVHVRLLNYTTQLHISYQLVAKCTYIMQEKGNASFNLSLTIMPDIAGGGEVGGAAEGLSDESHEPVHHSRPADHRAYHREHSLHSHERAVGPV